MRRTQRQGGKDTPRIPINKEQEPVSFVGVNYIWKRIPGEPQAYYDIFHCYMLQEFDRNVSAAWTAYAKQRYRYKQSQEGNPFDPSWKPPTCPNDIYEAARIFRWEDRVVSFDAYEKRRERAKWLKRRRELKEQAWGLQASIFDKVKQMIETPIFEEETTESKEIIETETGAVVQHVTKIVKTPKDWKLSDTSRLIAEGLKLARFAAAIEARQGHSSVYTEGEDVPDDVQINEASSANVGHTMNFDEMSVDELYRFCETAIKGEVALDG